MMTDEATSAASPVPKKRQALGPTQIIVPAGKVGGGAKARLVYENAEGLVTEFPLEDKNSIGRHPQNAIRLNDPEISKSHAIIEKRGANWFLVDQGSSNGTFVNGRRISEAPITASDKIEMGAMVLRLEQELQKPVAASQKEAGGSVTILGKVPDGSTLIHAKLQEDEDFRPVSEVRDVEVLKADYEKLRLSHKLSLLGLTRDLRELLERTLDVVFDMFPADKGVIMLVDEETNVLVPHTTRHRDKSKSDSEEILLSQTILNQVLNERASCLSSDAFVDPRFSGSQSIIAQGIRAAMAVPLAAKDKVLGVMHIDSRQRVGAFVEKDLQILKAIAAQAAIAIENTRLVRQIEIEAQTRGQLNRFLPPHVVEEMLAGKGEQIQKGGRELEASVVFCDIRGFTSMSESAGPQEIVDLLNDYFETLVEIVFQRHGVLDKFIGDALMASWGTLETDADPTFNAVAAALEFRDAVRRLNQKRSQEGLPPIMMGVGVNTGRLVAGYIGSKERLEYTVIGDTVNTASRLCGLAGGDQVVISEATYGAVSDRVEATFLGARRVKGKEMELGAYEALRLK